MFHKNIFENNIKINLYIVNFYLSLRQCRVYKDKILFLKNIFALLLIITKL